MPKAKKSPTRKSTLAATFGELASPKPVHPRQPDAKILRIVRELLVMESQLNALFARCDTPLEQIDAEPELTRLLEQQNDAERRMADLKPPRTQAGVQAVARLALARWSWRPDDTDEDDSIDVDFDDFLRLTVVVAVAKKGTGL